MVTHLQNSDSNVQFGNRSKLRLSASIFFLFFLIALSQLHAQSRTPWQMHRGAPLQYLGFKSESYGDSTEYIFESIPALNDTGWHAAPDPDVIDLHEVSAECAITDPYYNCRRVVDYSYFQTFVSYPQNMQLTTFTIRLYGIDDGCRLTVFNSTYPNGFAIPRTYVKLGDGGNKFSLLQYALPCEQNRFVITHVDDCCGGVDLDSAYIVLDGTVINSNVVSMTSTSIQCGAKDSSGTATANSTGVGPFTYLWNTNPPQTTKTAVNLPPGKYRCVVTPSLGCATVGEVNVLKAPAIKVTIANPSNVNLNTCAYGKTAHILLGYPGAPQQITLQATASGGTPIYTYSWSGGGVQYLSSKTIRNPVFNPAAQVGECSSYNLILNVNDSKGCIGSDTVEIRVVRAAVTTTTSSCSSSSSKRILICHYATNSSTSGQTLSITTSSLSSHGFSSSYGGSCSNSHRADCIGTCTPQCSSLSRIAGVFGENVTEEPESIQLTSIYPNPNDGNFKLLFDAETNTNVDFSIYDLYGKLIVKQQDLMVTEGADAFDLNLPQDKTPNGIYFISIKIGDSNPIIKKFSIHRE